MKQLLITFLTTLIGTMVGFSQAPAQTMSLEGAIAYAQTNNLEVKMARINIADAQEQIVERRAIGIPQLSASGSYQYFVDIPTQILPDFISPAVYGVLYQEGVLPPGEIPEGGTQAAQFGTTHNATGQLDLSALVFNGSYIVGLRAAKEYRVYVQEQLQATKANIRSQVVEAYVGGLILQENINTLDLNIENLGKILAETRALYNEGFVEQLDVDRLELSLVNLKTERDNLNRQLEIAENALKFTIGMPLEEEINLEDNMDDILASFNSDLLTQQISYSQRPEYRVASVGERLNELNVDIYRAGYLPTLSAFGSYQQSYLTNDLSEGEWFPTTVVGLQLNVPIFDGLEKKAQVERARLDLEGARIQKKQLEQAINLEISNARSAFLSARERVANQKRSLDLAQRIYDTTQIKYREGVGSSLEITQAEQELYQNQANYNQALYDLLVAKAALEKAVGY